MGAFLSCFTHEVKTLQEGDRVFFKTYFGKYICVLDSNNVTQVSDLQDGCYFTVKAFNPVKLAFKTFYGDTWLSIAEDGSVVQNNKVEDAEVFTPVYYEGGISLKSIKSNTYITANEDLKLTHKVDYNERTMLTTHQKYFN